MTTGYKLISEQELAAYADAIRRHGYEPKDFELQEDVFDPATAEVEAALGQVGVRCLKSQTVAAYRAGPGQDWLQDFDADLRAGRMGGRTNA